MVLSPLVVSTDILAGTINFYFILKGIKPAYRQAGRKRHYFKVIPQNVLAYNKRIIIATLLYDAVARYLYLNIFNTIYFI